MRKFLNIFGFIASIISAVYSIVFLIVNGDGFEISHPYIATAILLNFLGSLVLGFFIAFEGWNL